MSFFYKDSVCVFVFTNHQMIRCLTPLAKRIFNCNGINKITEKADISVAGEKFFPALIDRYIADRTPRSRPLGGIYKILYVLYRPWKKTDRSFALYTFPLRSKRFRFSGYISCDSIARLRDFGQFKSIFTALT